MIIERQIDSKISLTKGVAPPATNIYDYTQGQVESASSNLLGLIDGFTTGDAATSRSNASSLVAMLNNNPGADGDQALRITGIEKKVNTDGSIDVIISREGISDKTIPSKGLTPEQFDEEVFNTLNTFDISFEDALTSTERLEVRMVWKQWSTRPLCLLRLRLR